MSTDNPEYLQQSEERALADAEADGCYVDDAKDDELQLDIDRKTVPKEFWNRLDMLEDIGLLSEEETVDVRHSKSGNLHLTVKCPNRLTVPEKILLQMFLGSDPKREILSYRRFRNGHEHPIRLFRPKA